MQGFFQQFWGKAPGQNWEKMIDLTSKLGEINNIEHNRGSKIYPQNQVIFDCIMSSIPLKHTRLSILLIWVFVSHKLLLVVVVSKKRKKIFFFTFLNLEKLTWYWEKGGYFYWEWGQNSASGEGRKCPVMYFPNFLKSEPGWGGGAVLALVDVFSIFTSEIGFCTPKIRRSDIL